MEYEVGGAMWYRVRIKDPDASAEMQIGRG
jgi:hypothetical protein